MDLEIEFYTEILDEYATSCSGTEDEIFLWFCYSIIKLMKLTKDKRDSELVRNGLILILEHYQCVEEHLFDMQYSESNDLIIDDKDFYLTALKQEFV